MEDDFSTVSRLGRAYFNLGAPLSYVRAAGVVAIRWGRFEMQFTDFIRILTRRPDLVQLGSKIPGSFNDKSKLFRKIARLAFADCPSLADKLCDYSSRANQTCKKRNAIVHGSWFDHSFFKPDFGVTLSTEADGSGDFYSVTLDQIEALSLKIESLLIEGLVTLSHPEMYEKPFGYLTPDELSAMQAYHKNFVATAQAVPVNRHANRKGSPNKPEVFQA